ncbi:hypothetical protein [Streptomyces sp. cg35]|uniref:hypothetical protein n=1 Tax=Streptomyces sp. cg35 TaxID=3421650 RepID=UPI003D16A53E
MTFNPGTLFYGWSSLEGEFSGEPPTTTIKFSGYTELLGSQLPEGVTPITEQMVADTLNGLLADKGWPPIVFLGTPADEPLNPPAAS